jgi:hypothetical protein
VRHSLSFEFREGFWLIYLRDREKPIGEISPFPDGRWFGQMSLDGYKARQGGATPQDIIDAFEAWVAAGMPLGSPVLDLSAAIAFIV